MSEIPDVRCGVCATVYYGTICPRCRTPLGGTEQIQLDVIVPEPATAQAPAKPKSATPTLESTDTRGAIKSRLASIKIELKRLKDLEAEYAELTAALAAISLTRAKSRKRA